MLFEVAHQVALVVENMLAYEEIAQLKARMEQESVYLQEEIKTQHNCEEILGQSPAMQRVLHAIETVAPTDANVLILGETGTGKELIARAVYNLSPRQGRTLVKVNCAALPAGLIESELFGHEKGAFTGEPIVSNWPTAGHSSWMRSASRLDDLREKALKYDDSGGQPQAEVSGIFGVSCRTCARGGSGVKGVPCGGAPSRSGALRCRVRARRCVGLLRSIPTPIFERLRRF